MRYLSVCSGIEAATVAWHPLGWTPVAFAEVDRFPRAVLVHHFPEVPNLGDFTRIGPELGPVDLLVGGTPCQSFSIAGQRRGLDDPRGDLALEFIALARRVRARWVVFENVPGLLSNNGGRDFGTLLGALAKCGFGFAYRVLDAQYFGLAQRRERVIVVGHSGGLWQRAAAVLFDAACLSGHPAPRREAGPEVAGWAEDGPGDGSVTGPVTGPNGFGDCGDGARAKNLVVAQCHGGNVGPMGTLRRGNGSLTGGVPFVAHTLRGEGFDASEDGTGRGSPLVPVAFGWQNSAEQTMRVEDTCPPLETRKVPTVARALNARGGAGRSDFESETFVPGNGVRRLTPRECERLQGFPDDWTLVPYRRKPAKDAPRYRAIGNSMAVPVMAWLGRRIAAVEAS